MTSESISRVWGTILLTITIFSLSLPAYAKYSGGTGEPEDPYQIATAEDLMLLGESPEDYDKHFVLTADIDLDPSLPGRKVFDKAVIAPDTDRGTPSRFDGPDFTGVFDGGGQTISHLKIIGESCLGLFGHLGSGANVSNLALEAMDVNGTGNCVGGLVGYNWRGSITDYYGGVEVSGNEYVGGVVGTNAGTITTSYSTGTVSGNSFVGGLSGGNYDGCVVSCCSAGRVSALHDVGGLVGYNEYGSIATSYSTGVVTGSAMVGGLTGLNTGSITTSYSTGAVSGAGLVGGLVGYNKGGPSWSPAEGRTTASFWDVRTSGQDTSAGGMGLTTGEMQDIDTFLSEGWDFVGEVFNGTCDYWQMPPGDYPRLRFLTGDRPVMPEGLGTAEKPYLIRDARDLGTVWCEPMAHYRLEASVDLSGITWSMAVVPWFEGTFNGNRHVISSLHIEGGSRLGLFALLHSGAVISNVGLEAVAVNGTGGDIGGLVGFNSYGSITASYSTGEVSGNSAVGGLVGSNSGSTATSFSSATITGQDGHVGGLVGYNYADGRVTSSYSRGTVRGDSYVGGLVGWNFSSIAASYSTGAVSGNLAVGGLVGSNIGTVTLSFWDMETSGLISSDGGIRRTTAEMQTASTFLEAGWDFMDETYNGTEDIWWILEGQDYPRLWWQYGQAFSPYPQDGAVDVPQPLTLSWLSGGSGLYHDVYFGEDKESVANATIESSSIYRGRQEPEMTTYNLDTLELEKTYYWRIDEVNQADLNSPCKGDVWCFTTANFIVVDDFENYDADNQIWWTWRDGLGYATESWPEFGTGSVVGDESTLSYTEETIVHGGRQSMPYRYDNDKLGFAKYSHAERFLSYPRDWTKDGVSELSLWFHGRPASVGSFVEEPSGTYTMTGSGTDIGGERDQFHFAYKRLTDSGSILVRIESIENTHEWAKAGVMIRWFLHGESQYAFVYVTPSNGIAFQARAECGQTSSTTNQTGITAPLWIKLERDEAGNFTASHSADGKSWQQVTGATPQNIAMDSNVYIGLAVTSHNAALTCQVVFSNVTITGTVSQLWMNQDIGIESNSPEPLYVAVSNVTGTPAVVVHDDPSAATIHTWTEWLIPLSEFADQGIYLDNVDRIALGLGTVGNMTVPGGSGKMYFDDIRLYRLLP